MTKEEKVFYQGAGIYKIEKGDSYTYINGSSLVPRKEHGTCYGVLTNSLDIMITPSISQETKTAILHHYLNTEEHIENAENSKDSEFTSPSS